ncbi:LytTR family DNA-binding domain-containing protein [Aquimarina sp. 2201CG5-10]|uniref:LytR/AlgR family response regulator transcription factor n=1 Tax=Aquimarina callyspongiae TaxID=3098150 RepID=UPI002AB37F3E|nr:LytTR family DNA-binding domain-containing protein [Aquimarina sp. 2201CG5-10]MDY8136006.1 LytTR family DNA-binding domain-containing protein [Aquimarina sp. 2201CG5-10]
MAIKCIVIDDEPLAIKVLEKHIKKVPELELVSSFDNPIHAADFLQNNTIDLLFLDIQMPVVTGIDFIKNTTIQPKVILTTAYREYALEGYELDIIDYLLKPISFIRFYKAINKYKTLTAAMQHSSGESSEAKKTLDHIFVNANKRMIRIEFNDILFIDSIKDYVRIHTINDTVITKDKISVFLQKLPANFLRVHRSYIINNEKITSFTSKDIVLLGGMEIPIGASYKEVIKLIKNR